MLSLKDQWVVRDAVERLSGRAGQLSTYVEVHVRGNYRNGPVPVTVRYCSYFRYDIGWTGDDGHSILATSNGFDSAPERDAFARHQFIIKESGS